MTNQDVEKQNAAKASIGYVKEGMIVGLGSGSTSEHMVNFLGKEVQNGLKIRAVSSSERITVLARSLRIPLTTLAQAKRLDLYIDGADEIDPYFNMIKGGGGALLREKILAYNSKKRVIIVDATKQVERLGKFKLPLEVIPFAHQSIEHELKTMHLKPLLRGGENEPYQTDEGNYIIDVDISGVDNYHGLNESLLSIPGIVETGLFLEYVNLLIVGIKDETIVLSKKNS